MHLYYVPREIVGYDKRTIYAAVRGDNPPAVACGLSPVQTLRPYGNLLNQQHAIALC